MSNLDHETLLMILKADVVNSQTHVFVDHVNYGRYSCQGPKEGNNPKSKRILSEREPIFKNTLMSF